MNEEELVSESRGLRVAALEKELRGEKWRSILANAQIASLKAVVKIDEKRFRKAVAMLSGNSFRQADGSEHYYEFRSLSVLCEQVVNVLQGKPIRIDVGDRVTVTHAPCPFADVRVGP